MNLYLRLIWVLFTGLFKKRIGLLNDSVLKFRVMPNDLDIYGHMNNGRYLTIMDLGRMDLILRTGMKVPVKKHHWNPLIASSIIRFKNSLKPFKSYELRTRIVAWDDKWFYIEQRFERKGRLFARAVVQGLFRGPHGNVKSTHVLSELGLELSSPNRPEILALFSHVSTF